MVYCPECGSEVAPQDTFCAYCGIALQPVAAAVETAVSESGASDSAAADEKLSNTFPPGTIQNPAGETEMPKDRLIEEKFGKEVYAELNPKTAAPERLHAAKNDSPYLKEEKESQTENKSFDNFGDAAPLSNTFPPQSLVSSASSSPAFAENNLIDEAQKPSPQGAVTAVSEDGALPEREQNKFAEQETQIEVQTDENSVIVNPVETPNREPNMPEAIREDGKAVVSESVPVLKPVEDFNVTIPYAARNVDLENASESTLNQIIETSSEVGKSNDFTDNAVAETAAESGNERKQPAGEFSDAENHETAPVDISINPEGEAEKDFGVAAAPDDFGKAEKELSKSADESFKSAEDNSVSEQSEPEEPVEQKESRPYTVPNLTVSNTDGKRSSKLKPLDEGTILNGRYEIVRKIGGGGMGAVYLAGDRNLGGVLRAVKEMVQTHIEEAQQEKSVNDFRRESMILSTLDHPAVPTIYDYFFDETESRFYLVMKYINGGDLAARLRSSQEGKIDERSVTEWGIQIADVLDYLHNRPTPVIYRDLKPSNIMIDGNSGRVMLIDFGIARSVNKEEKGVTAVGTMGYAPPELFGGNVEPRSDIYSLGSTMFHLLTGADPQSNPLLIFDFNKNPRPRQINSRLSDQIEQILMRAVQYNSAQRFNSAAEMRDMLKTHLENLQKGMVTYGVAVNTPSPSREFNIPVFCGFCGQKILATDVFCPFCGAKQPLLNEPASSKQIMQVQKTARLTIIGTSDLVEPEYILEKETNLVGRRDPMSNIFPEVDLSKFDPQTKISRRHAQIRIENNQYLIEDLGSSNGTILMSPVKDAVRLQPRQAHVLTGGDKIKVGDTILQFIVG